MDESSGPRASAAAAGEAPAPEVEVTDTELVRLANSGDESGFERLYLRHRDWVVRLAWSFARNREDALDVMQDAFAYLFGKFPGFKLRAKMTTFLFPVVRNLALERARKRGRTVPMVSAGGSEPEAPPLPDHVGATERQARVADALLELNEGEREVVRLRFTDAMKLGEIASALGVPLGTVKSRLHSALARLRKTLHEP
jgi:RNA polymerase sigma-70 factor (ECF subfamily)